MNNSQSFTVSIYTENNVGLLNRISAIFQRRHINIESINTSISEVKNVSRWTIVVNTQREMMEKITGQIEKQIEVIKAYFHTEEELVYQESCLFKMEADILLKNPLIQERIKSNNARIVMVDKRYMVIEKSGSKEEINQLYTELEPLGFLQYVRSGRISVSKEKMKVFGKLKSK